MPIALSKKNRFVILDSACEEDQNNFDLSPQVIDGVTREQLKFSIEL